MPDILAEAVHSGEACGASVSEMMKDHLPSDQPENVFEDGPSGSDPVQRSLPHPIITISDRILASLSPVKTTISNPEQLEADSQKYQDGRQSATCECDSCKARSALVQQQQNQPAPIMVTPYRHNWIISGNHKGAADDSETFDFRNCCQIQ